MCTDVHLVTTILETSIIINRLYIIFSVDMGRRTGILVQKCVIPKSDPLHKQIHEG